MLVNQAVSAATQAGLMVLRPFAHAYSVGVPYGEVLAQAPAAGASVPLGTRVVLTVSDGPPPAPGAAPSIPDVLGVDVRTAERMVEGAGCNINPLAVFAFSDTVAQGLIIAQSPSPAVSAPAGTVVTLTVSLGVQVTYVGESSVTVPVMH